MKKLLRVLKTCKYCICPEFCGEKPLCDGYLTEYILVIKVQDSEFQIGPKRYYSKSDNPEWKAVHKRKEKIWKEKQKEERNNNPIKKVLSDYTQKKWRENNRDYYLAQHRIHSQNRRNKETGEKIKIEQWKKLCEKYNNKCLACGKSGDYKTLTMDHVVPVMYGGKNDIKNIQPLCKNCNSAKGTKIIDYRTL